MNLPPIPADIAERADILCDQFRHIEDDREFVARILMELGQGVHAGLTKRQQAAFDLLKSQITADGVSPTIREIATGLGITLSRAHSVMKQLEHRGLITMVPRCPRSIAIVGRA
ncbi:MAG TPA: hypothetical protein VGN60_07680 [Devosia sp.]|jgi:hypothetical protein|nr:hypothetical protein [Devosia sp.]